MNPITEAITEIEAVLDQYATQRGIDPDINVPHPYAAILALTHIAFDDQPLHTIVQGGTARLLDYTCMQYTIVEGTANLDRLIRP